MLGAVPGCLYRDGWRRKSKRNLIRPLGIKELVRTGPIAMARGERMLKIKETENKGGEEDG